MKRHNDLRLRRAESTSLQRAAGFNYTPPFYDQSQNCSMSIMAIEDNGAATSTSDLSLPGPSKSIADEQTEEVRADLKNNSSKISILIEDSAKTTASQDILEEIL
ncbi:hypothetical protein AVEN_261422-1 [Araneus ventricosus]|uniref:Uncharacterized protein n=1 Tax=Araneus ventricosus TaxID=182803 RepID=A0A4Y2GTJ0_ARAVE|nr:hypothetical protein AVEN_261422-1 [Araneus ventricosus]